MPCRTWWASSRGGELRKFTSAMEAPRRQGWSGDPTCSVCSSERSTRERIFPTPLQHSAPLGNWTATSPLEKPARAVATQLSSCPSSPALPTAPPALYTNMSSPKIVVHWYVTTASSLRRERGLSPSSNHQLMYLCRLHPAPHYRLENSRSQRILWLFEEVRTLACTTFQLRDEGES